MIRYFLLLLFFSLTFHTSHGIIREVLNIGLFWDHRPTSVVVTPAYGEYFVYAEGEKVFDMEHNEALQILVKDGQVLVKTLKKTIGTYSKVRIVRKQWGASVKIKSVIPARSEKVFDDNLMISVYGRRLKVVNNVYIEHYVAGVIESESGIKEPLEYYKVQAIICRTYALSNMRRHEDQGFHLCDQVHCQVYKQKSQLNPNIVKATNKTKGIVIVDSDIRLITATFSSNCGGHTVNSEDVWKYPLPYLKGRKDTFCLRQPHATWEREIAKSNWLDYLKRRHDYPVNDSLHSYCALNFCYDERQNFLTPLDSSIILTSIRSDWNLKSTYFSIEERKDSILIKGVGYGHGVGLCQEGAMRMAELGYRFNEILHYYYTNVHLIPLSALDFFREE